MMSDAAQFAALKSELLAILNAKSVCRGDFTLASGAKSDLYIDARVTTSDPRAALLIGRIGWRLITKTAMERGVRVEGIGGLTMGADWFALSVGICAQLEDPANQLNVFSVRKSVKEHGRQKRIEGNFSPGQFVVVVDDVITTGGSTLQAIDAVEGEGGKVAFVLVLMDREEGGRAAIEGKGHAVVSIFTRADLVATAQPSTAAG
jgi:orotate phosphoribosyltransferase